MPLLFSEFRRADNLSSKFDKAQRTTTRKVCQAIFRNLHASVEGTTSSMLCITLASENRHDDICLYMPIAVTHHVPTNDMHGGDKCLTYTRVLVCDRRKSFKFERPRSLLIQLQRIAIWVSGRCSISTDMTIANVVGILMVLHPSCILLWPWLGTDTSLLNIPRARTIAQVLSNMAISFSNEYSEQHPQFCMRMLFYFAMPVTACRYFASRLLEAATWSATGLGRWDIMVWDRTPVNFFARTKEMHTENNSKKHKPENASQAKHEQHHHGKLKLYELGAPGNPRCLAGLLSFANSSRRFFARRTASTLNCKSPWSMQSPQNLGWLALKSSVKSSRPRNDRQAWVNSWCFPRMWAM